MGARTHGREVLKHPGDRAICESRFSLSIGRPKLVDAGARPMNGGPIDDSDPPIGPTFVSPATRPVVALAPALISDFIGRTRFGDRTDGVEGIRPLGSNPNISDQEPVSAIFREAPWRRRMAWQDRLHGEKIWWVSPTE